MKDYALNKWVRSWQVNLHAPFYLSQLVLGETAEVLEVSGEWRQVRARLDRYLGWVHGGYCFRADDAESDAWAGREH